MFNRMLLLAMLALTNLAFASNEVTIYSVYPGEELKDIFAPFTQQTGIKVHFVEGTSSELLERLSQEGENTAADLYLDKDLVFHSKGKALGLYRPYESKIVDSQVPAHLVDQNKNWVTVFYRARVIMFNKNVVKASELSTYEDLASDKWKGRLCVRTSTNSYNQALGAYFLTHLGFDKTVEVLKGWVNNFSTAPLAGDRDVIRAVAEGKCDVGIANSYYLPSFIRADANYPVLPFFPNQETTGTHVNGVGIGIAKHAKNVKNATLLMEYFTSQMVQTPVAAAFSQYPVNKSAELTQILKDFGSFVEDTTNTGIIGEALKDTQSAFSMANYL